MCSTPAQENLYFIPVVVIGYALAQVVSVSFLPGRPGFAPMAVRVGFVVGKVSSGKVFLRVLRFFSSYCQYHFIFAKYSLVCRGPISDCSSTYTIVTLIHKSPFLSGQHACLSNGKYRVRFSVLITAMLPEVLIVFYCQSRKILGYCLEIGHVCLHAHYRNIFKLKLKWLIQLLICTFSVRIQIHVFIYKPIYRQACFCNDNTLVKYI